MISDDGLPAIFEAVQNSTDEMVMHGLPDLVPIRAGVVAWNGRAALLPGARQAGKTTLVAELLKKGAVYYSDAYALTRCPRPGARYPRVLMPRDPVDCGSLCFRRRGMPRLPNRPPRCG